MEINFFFKNKKFYIFLVYFFLCFLIFYDLYFNRVTYSYPILIKTNQTLKEISEFLYKNNIIKNKFFFEFLVHSNLAQTKLKAGEYIFFKENIFQVTKKIKKGDVFQRKVTIPEGLTSQQTIDILKNTKGIIVNKNIHFIDEGSLFPSTYFYVYDTDINEIINKMQVSMNMVLEELWRNRDKDVKLKNYREVLILASIVEKETSLKEEKRIISQIFLNRLNLNMKLQSDPTVLFAINKELGELDRKLTKNDLKFESDYNTYLHHGLPIGPISNPGKDSIEATTNPLKSNFLYFVADGFGGHLFSDNYDEHLSNIKKVKKSK